MYTIYKEGFFMKAMYINECQCNFVDNQGELIFSFKSCNRITFLDIRKLQLASMIKGAWCNPDEITYYLSSLHTLSVHEVGKIVNFFRLFDFDSEELIKYLPADIRKSILIHFGSNDFDYFFIEEFERDNEFLLQSVEEFCSRWRLLMRGKIYTIGDLVNSTKSKLLHIKHLGPKAVDEIEALLAEKGLYLKEENE